MTEILDMITANYIAVIISALALLVSYRTYLRGRYNPVSVIAIHKSERSCVPHAQFEKYLWGQDFEFKVVNLSSDREIYIDHLYGASWPWFYAGSNPNDSLSPQINVNQTLGPNQELSFTRWTAGKDCAMWNFKLTVAWSLNGPHGTFQKSHFKFSVR